MAPVLALSAAGLLALPAAAAPQLETFGTGQVTTSGGTVTITNTIVNDPVWGVGPSYGGVYLKSRSLSSKLADVEVSFRSTGDVAGGAPRFSIPIDDRDPATKDTYAFLAPDRCGGASGQSTVVSTELANCIVDLNGNFAASLAGASYANWDAFVAANPTFRVQPGGIPIIIADGAVGTYVVTDIVLR
jgi:hypothetical protein